MIIEQYHLFCLGKTTHISYTVSHIIYLQCHHVVGDNSICQAKCALLLGLMKTIPSKRCRFFLFKLKGKSFKILVKETCKRGEGIYTHRMQQTQRKQLSSELDTNATINSKAIIRCKVTLDIIHALAAATQFAPYKSNEVV